MYKQSKNEKNNNMKKLTSYTILIPIIILNILSLIYLWNTLFFYKQLIFIILGLILLLITSNINIKKYRKKIPYLYIISIILLLLVLRIGKEIKGAKAWLRLFNISIQPSEITKLVLIIYYPFLTMKNKKISLIILTIIPSVLTFLEPDTGAIIFYLIILLTAIFYTKINKKIIITTLLILTILISSSIYLYFNNKDLFINIYTSNIFYRIDRIISFTKHNNIQNVNSLISIGAHHLLYIPENHNDFIFASIISKYNILTFILILLSYSYIFIYLIKNISKKKSIFKIYNHILLNILIFQTFYNILMNLSLLPIIGIPLPFISYGGSYLITLYLEIGILISLTNKKGMVDKDHKKDKLELD